jgi:hypothetical protein
LNIAFDLCFMYMELLKEAHSVLQLLC